MSSRVISTNIPDQQKRIKVERSIQSYLAGYARWYRWHWLLVGSTAAIGTMLPAGLQCSCYLCGIGTMLPAGLQGSCYLCKRALSLATDHASRVRCGLGLVAMHNAARERVHFNWYIDP